MLVFKIFTIPLGTLNGKEDYCEIYNEHRRINWRTLEIVGLLVLAAAGVTSPPINVIDIPLYC